MDYGLPETVNICNQDVPVRYDYRAILDIMEAYNISGLSGSEKVYAALLIFYPDFPNLPDAPSYGESIEAMQNFINGGRPQAKQTNSPQLVSWEDDYPYICSAVNRVLGYEIRSVKYDREANTGGVHWWTFLAAYMEVGDCFFAQIVGIRNKLSKNKKLDKQDQEFYRQNKALIDCVKKTDAADEAWIKTIV